MIRLKRQDGSGLILVIGVIATLAILAATLVLLTNNMQHNTYTDRTRAKAFNVTEAALDYTMSALASKWPVASGAGPDFGTTAQADFRSQFSTSEYPSPTATGTSFVQMWYYDNLDPIDTSVHWDKGSPDSSTTPDKRMWVVVQSGVGPSVTRIQALVEKDDVNIDVPRGVALFTGANLLSNGGGNNPKINVEVPPPSTVNGGEVSIKVVGDIDDVTVSAAGIVQKTGAAAGNAEGAFPSGLRTMLKGVAQLHNRYFTSIAAAENSPADPIWSPGGGLTGLTVIEPPTFTTLTVKDDYNSVDAPGIVMLLGGSNLDFGGGGNFWGVMYTDGTVDKGHGNFIIHGMLVAASTVDMRGTVNVNYNDNCIARLSTRWPLSIRLVPDTWRELPPGAAP
jgi:hypothetical protein